MGLDWDSEQIHQDRTSKTGGRRVAKSTKSRKKAAAPEVIPPTETPPEVTDTSAAAPVEDAEIVTEDAPLDSDEASTDALAPDEAETDAEADAETVAETDTETTPNTDPAPMPAETPQPAGSPIVPLVIGGVVAGAIGFGAAWMLMPADDGQALRDLDTRLQTQGAHLSTLADTVDAIEPADLTPLETALAAQETTLGTLATRITALEARPVGDSGVTAGELAQLQQSLAAQQAETQAMTAELDRLASQQDAGLRNAETEALQQARAAQQAAARQVLRAALGNGEPFAEVLATLDPPLPGSIASIATDGIPTAESLTKPFDALARQALSAARAEASGEGDTSTRLATFLRAQLGARSVEPRAGDDPDAVLSRAQFAANTGDFASALTEIAALPEVAQAAFADWVPLATARATATTAITDYLSANQGQ